MATATPPPGSLCSMPIVHRASEPITENAKRAIDLRSVLAEKSSWIFRHGLRFAK
jgi:hypothetical protein